MARLLITGGSSYLGRALLDAATAHDVTFTYWQNPVSRSPGDHKVDVRDSQAVASLVDACRPEAIIHLAGSNRGDDYEQVIRRGAHHITAAARAAGARLIHLSTDSLFDGRAAPYTEDAEPTPLHAYGAAKAAAETAVAAHPDHVIVRTSLIYDLDRLDHSTAWIAAALEAGQPVTLFTNQLRNPITAQTLSAAILELLEMPYRGRLNIAGEQVLSRADFGLRLLDWWGITARQTLRLAPTTGNRWPLDTTLDIRRARQLLRTPLPGVDAVLARRRAAAGA